MLGRWADSLSKPRKKHSLENFKYAWTKRANERESERERERKRASAIRERERGRERTIENARRGIEDGDAHQTAMPRMRPLFTLVGADEGEGGGLKGGSREGLRGSESPAICGWWTPLDARCRERMCWRGTADDAGGALGEESATQSPVFEEEKRRRSRLRAANSCLLCARDPSTRQPCSLARSSDCGSPILANPADPVLVCGPLSGTSTSS